MKILFLASEAYPFVKTGGLGDVIYSLPKELRKIGIDARVMMPKYNDIPEFFRRQMRHINEYNIQVGWRSQYCGIDELCFEDVPFYFLDNEYYYKRQGIYGFYDDGERYAFFCKGALESIRHMDFKPDVIHCNDWHSGMVSVLLNAHYKNSPEYKDIKTVFTIHNLQYQGVFSKEILGELLNIGDEYFNIDGVEFFGGVSFMKGALNFSDIITTVSETYAKEIQTSYYGERLDPLLRKKNDSIHGIVNGIDYNLFDPSIDKSLAVNYNSYTIEKKVNNKQKLQEMLNLPINDKVPVIAMVTRLVRQKGIDLIAHILDEVLAMDIQLVILGTGDSQYENLFKGYEQMYPKKLSANIGFDEILARRIYAGSDIFLMPSLFEPCGIGQLIALRYGSLPIVRETGGLNDTVTSYNEYTGEGNGFSFAHYNGNDLLYTIKRAIEFYKDKDTWYSIVKRAMEQDYSWKNSAIKYMELYKKLVE